MQQQLQIHMWQDFSEGVLNEESGNAKSVTHKIQKHFVKPQQTDAKRSLKEPMSNRNDNSITLSQRNILHT